jgi:hypothetical protein
MDLVLPALALVADLRKPMPESAGTTGEPPA